jgi:hypothetical protein
MISRFNSAIDSIWEFEQRLLMLFKDFMDFFGLFSEFSFTLAQMSTIKPMFFVFTF